MFKPVSMWLCIRRCLHYSTWSCSALQLRSTAFNTAPLDRIRQRETIDNSQDANPETELSLNLAIKELTLFFTLHLFLPPAPSPVTIIKKEKTSRNSVSLSWQQPERPNGIILDYEIKYYEKVGAALTE